MGSGCVDGDPEQPQGREPKVHQQVTEHQDVEGIWIGFT
jgi:hypothetical protein